MKLYSNILEMVGRTPMLEVKRLDTGPCQLFLKLELMNPGGSVKDRIGISMIGEAERRGDISPFRQRIPVGFRHFHESRIRLLLPKPVIAALSPEVNIMLGRTA